MDKVDAAVLATLPAGMPMSVTEVTRRSGLPRPVVVATIARLAATGRVSRAISFDDGSIIERWTLARPKPLVPPVAAG